MKPFINTLFPTDISLGSIGGPEFLTAIVELRNGVEHRNIVRKYPRARYNIGYGIKTQDQLDRVRSLYYVTHGRAYGFRFRDPSDHSAERTELGIGDDKKRVFPVSKTYRVGEFTFTRRITRPVKDGFKVYVNAKPIANWVLDEDEGQITLAHPLSQGAKLEASFMFDVPVRFETDYLPIKIEAHNVVSIYDIELREILHESACSR